MVNLYDMKASELLRELTKNGAVSFRRQTLDSHIQNGKIPYWTDHHGRKKFCYVDSLSELVKAGLAVEVSCTNMKSKDIFKKLHTDNGCEMSLKHFKFYTKVWKIPYTLNDKGKKRFNYSEVLKTFIKAGVAR